MSKNINEYIHYYLGQCAIFDNKEWKIAKVSRKYIRLERGTDGSNVEVHPDEMKIILRKLQSISEAEIKDFIGYDKLNSMYKNVQFKKHDSGIKVAYDIDAGGEGVYPQDHWIDFSQPRPDEFHYYIMHGYDVFGLIKDELAVERKDVKFKNVSF